MMNNPDAGGGGGSPSSCYDNAGKATDAAAAVPTTGESGSFFADMVADYSTDDLFELAWEQEGGQAGGAPAVCRLWSPRFSSKPSDVRFDPPSEDEMAVWLSDIVKGEELACKDDADDGSRQPTAGLGDVVPAPATVGTSTLMAMDKKEKVPTTTTDGMMMGNKMRKTPAGGSLSSRRSHHGEAHNLTEKRRRHKINERLKTLQQLVPGCSKSNQASTLDQTIHYMKTLQHQVQAMSVGGLAAPCVPPGTPVAMPFPAAPMVPFGTTMLQLPHYPTAAVMLPLYPAAAPSATSTAVTPGDAISANLLHGSSSRSSSTGRGKESSSMYKSDRT